MICASGRSSSRELGRRSPPPLCVHTYVLVSLNARAHVGRECACTINKRFLASPLVQAIPGSQQSIFAVTLGPKHRSSCCFAGCFRGAPIWCGKWRNLIQGQCPHFTCCVHVGWEHTQWCWCCRRPNRRIECEMVHVSGGERDTMQAQLQTTTACCDVCLSFGSDVN